ncbi:MAG: TM2 domain-containing protein [Candidatus Sericytochromatia bacterium]|nr:TM2 domain-containing protein [Candidatus Sericytochromatia bacterium]
MNKSEGKIYCHFCLNSSGFVTSLDELRQSVTTSKRRDLAIILAFLLGSLGGHKFYLGQYGWGIMYFLFSWTGIPMLAGWIEGIALLMQSDADFVRRYGDAQPFLNLPRQTQHMQLGRGSGGLRLSQPVMSAALPPKDYERFLLQFAQRNKGLISMAQLMAEHEVSLEKAEDALARLAAKGLVVSEIDDNGRVLYYVPEFRN